MASLSRRAVLAGAAALAACRPAPAVTPAFAGAMVEVEGVPIHLVRSGRGRPLVLIHGASGNLNDMTFRLAPALADRFEVIAVDRPGHGRSYGGSVALAWAVAAPGSVAALVLLATPSQVWEGGLGLTNDLLASPLTGPALAWSVPRLVTDRFAERTLATVFAPQAPPGGYLDHLDLSLILQPASLRENARQLVALKEELRPMVPAYPRLPMPIALVHGDADTTVGLDIHSRPFARQVPHARLAVLPGIGHMLHQVAAPEVVGGIRAVAG